MSSILVVEDDRSTRQLLMEVLKTAGFSVTSAKDGVDALKRLRAGSYDLMLLDVWMPKMNGLDVLAALPEEGARPRVVVMTADDTPETLLKVVREQACRYVVKPVEPEALVELLREVLAQTAVAPGSRWCRPGLTGSSCWCRASARRWIESRASCRTSRPICRPTSGSRLVTHFGSC